MTDETRDNVLKFPTRTRQKREQLDARKRVVKSLIAQELDALGISYPPPLIPAPEGITGPQDAVQAQLEALQWRYRDVLTNPFTTDPPEDPK